MQMEMEQCQHFAAQNGHQDVVQFLHQVVPGRFRGPSGRAPFSDEGGFTFSEAPFEGTLHEGLKGASPSEGFKGSSPSEGGA